MRGAAMSLYSRQGKMVPPDLFINTQGEWNTVVVAPSGAGMSVLASQVATQYQSAGAKLWIIDKGSSFTELSSVVDERSLAGRK